MELLFGDSSQEVLDLGALVRPKLMWFITIPENSSFTDDEPWGLSLIACKNDLVIDDELQLVKCPRIVTVDKNDTALSPSSQLHRESLPILRERSGALSRLFRPSRAPAAAIGFLMTRKAVASPSQC